MAGENYGNTAGANPERLVATDQQLPTFKVEYLTNVNYDLWASKLKNVLQLYKVWKSQK